MTTNRQYNQEYKIQAVKLAKEIGQAKAARELGIPKIRSIHGYALIGSEIWILERDPRPPKCYDPE